MVEKLIFYSAHTRKFEASVRAKIRAILEQNAIEYDKEQKVFLCKPILQKDGTPYNHTTYTLKAHKEFEWTCSCQGFQTKLKEYGKDMENQPRPHCAHVAALWEYIKRGHLARREEKVGQAMLSLFG